MIFPLERIRAAVHEPDAIPLMRDALLAHHRGECQTPLPMHLDPAGGEVHIKASYRKGGAHFALKAAGSFAAGPNGCMLVFDARTGGLAALLADQGYLTDLRTAAVAAMLTRELGRTDRVLGILGTGVQARLSVRLHAAVLQLDQVLVWGRNPDKTEALRHELHATLPGILVSRCETPGEVAAAARLLVTCTASRIPLLHRNDLQPGTHVHAIGADSPGKQELDPAILRAAACILVDSRAQGERLGELQHAPELAAVEMGAFLEAPEVFADTAITVADFTGLGVEDLVIAEYALERLVHN